MAMAEIAAQQVGLENGAVRPTPAQPEPAQAPQEQAPELARALRGHRAPAPAGLDQEWERVLDPAAAQVRQEHTRAPCRAERERQVPAAPGLVREVAPAGKVPAADPLHVNLKSRR